MLKNLQLFKIFSYEDHTYLSLAIDIILKMAINYKTILSQYFLYHFRIVVQGLDSRYII